MKTNALPSILTCTFTLALVAAAACGPGEGPKDPSGPPGSSGAGQPHACTEEAKVCPDGSSVSRAGPNCEFAPCPSTTPPSPPAKGCTREAKVCPDGSSVGRTGPNCEFAACPPPK